MLACAQQDRLMEAVRQAILVAICSALQQHTVSPGKTAPWALNCFTSPAEQLSLPALPL